MRLIKKYRQRETEKIQYHVYDVVSEESFSIRGILVVNTVSTLKNIEPVVTNPVNSEKGLKRTLSSRALVALGIGAIIGAGLFSLTGIAAAEHAGPAVTLSFVLAAVGCAFAGLCYAEFASMIPVAGSAYTYSYATMGEFMARLS